MGTPNYPRSIGDTINQLRRQAAAAYTSSNTRQALTEIKEKILNLYGQITVKPGGKFIAQYVNGQTALQVGANMLSDGTPVHGVLIKRPGGETVLWTYGRDDGGSAFWALYDRSGNIIMSDDAASTQGLATPYIPIKAMPTVQITATGRQASTTSSSFTALYTINGHKQHPKMRVTAAIMHDSGVAGELRVRDPASGAIVMAPVVFGPGTYVTTDFTFSPGGAHMSWQQLDIEMRVTSGTGAVGLTVVAAYGIQS